MLIELFSSCSVIRASVPKMNLDDAFEQKNDIAKAVEDELEKVCFIICCSSRTVLFLLTFLFTI